MVNTLPQDTEQFLKLLFQDGDYITICFKDPGKQKLQGFKTTPFSDALNYAKWVIAKGKQAFFGVLPRSPETPAMGTPGAREHILPGRVVWVDLDPGKAGKPKEDLLDDLRNSRHLPSIIVDSGNGY